MLLVTGSIFLLTILIMNFYASNTGQLEIAINNEAIFTATGIGQAVIDNIQTRAFDENTVNSSVSNVDSLTFSNNLGADAGEYSPTSFDDVDDFKNYSTTDASTRLGTYNILVDVNYVTTANPTTVTSSRTFLKKIDVFVTADYLPDTLKLYHLIAY